MGALSYLKSEKKETKPVFLRCDKELVDKIEKHRKASKMSKNKFVAKAVEFFIKQLEKESKK